ncbi:hypothetical protein [Algibacter lectus]|uniref:hypothetical protein n=1 Tax=Algibacter lectus TaxID=221126 RepID=UPI0026EE3815|nr:hypothetical protein [Algibacter lectus]MDO7138172.1 hypothetical protein [Algibacter lectus]
MKKNDVLLVLWVIFGFVFVTAVDTILNFIIHLLYFSLVELGVSFLILTYLLPSITLVTYLFTACFVVGKINRKSLKLELYKREFPKLLLVVLSLIIFILGPLTNWLSGLYSESISKSHHGDIQSFLVFYGWFTAGFGISQMISLISLVIYLLIKLKDLNNN